MYDVQIAAYIAYAAQHEITLSREDFVIDPDCGPTLDGVDAIEWLEAMTAE